MFWVCAFFCHDNGTVIKHAQTHHWPSFPLLETNFRDVGVDASSWLEHACFEVWLLLDLLYRWRGGRSERSQQTWRRCSVWLRLSGSSQFVCVAFLCQPAGHKSSHCEATYWRAACQWPEKQERGEKRDSPPVKGNTTWNRGAAKAPETKKKKNPDMSESFSHSCMCLTVSQSFDLIQSDTLREYFSPCHPRAIWIIFNCIF